MRYYGKKRSVTKKRTNRSRKPVAQRKKRVMRHHRRQTMKMMRKTRPFNYAHPLPILQVAEMQEVKELNGGLNETGGLCVVSLFDGIGAGYAALRKAGIKVDLWIAFEIQPVAIAMARANIPEAIYVEAGAIMEDVDTMVGIVYNALAGRKLHLVCGGPPCQDLSAARGMARRQGLEGSKSSLLFPALRLIEQLHPEHVIIENVASMANQDLNEYHKYVVSQTCCSEEEASDASS
jgi:hypothetical protein